MNLVITTHSGKEYHVQVEEYNVTDLNEQLNNERLNTVVIGSIVLSRIDVKGISPENI